MKALEDLERLIKACPIGRLPAVVAALEGVTGGGWQPAKTEAFARGKALPKTHAELIELETAMLRHALEESDGNQSAAARAVGLDRKTFIRRARKLGVA